MTFWHWWHLDFREWISPLAYECFMPRQRFFHMFRICFICRFYIQDIGRTVAEIRIVSKLLWVPHRTVYFIARKIDYYRLLYITYFMNSGCKNGCNNTTVLVMGKFDLRVGFRFYTRAGYKTETKVTPSLLRSTCQLLQRSTIYFRTNPNFVQKHFSYFYGRGWPRGRKQTETTTDKQTNKQQGTSTDLR